MLIGASASGTYFYAYQQGLEEGQRSLPPVILAEKADKSCAGKCAGRCDEQAG